MTEQLKAMSAQLESLERGQVRAREVPVPPDEEICMPATLPIRPVMASAACPLAISSALIVVEA